MHPWVGPDLLDSGSLITVICEEFQNEILEVSTEVSLIRLLEILVCLIRVEQVVEVFVSLGLLERENATHDDPGYYSNREHVDLLATVGLTLLNLGRHVRHCATVGTKCVDVLVGGKSEVCNLQVELIID